MMIIAYIDGACRFNPGPAGIGVVLLSADGRVLKEISQYLGHGTNNMAEWSAYLKALEVAKVLGAEMLKIYTDSKLLAEQVSGNYKIRDARLQGYWRQSQGLRQGFSRIDVIHVPREQNKHADSLARQAVEGKPASATDSI